MIVVNSGHNVCFLGFLFCRLAGFTFTLSHPWTFFFLFISAIKKGDKVIGAMANAHRVSLECLNRPVLSQLTDVDAHVCAARGKGVIALPVNIQGRSCREDTHNQAGELQLDQCGERSKANLSGRGTAAWLLLCGHPRWLLSIRVKKKKQHKRWDEVEQKWFFFLNIKHHETHLVWFDLLFYLIYTSTEDKVALFIPF